MCLLAQCSIVFMASLWRLSIGRKTGFFRGVFSERAGFPSGFSFLRCFDPIMENGPDPLIRVLFIVVNFILSDLILLTFENLINDCFLSM